MSMATDQIKAILESNPALAAQVGDKATEKEILEALNEMFLDQKRQIDAGKEPTKMLSAQIPVSLHDTISEISKTYKISRKQLVVDSLYEYLENKKDLFPDVLKDEEKK